MDSNKVGKTGPSVGFRLLKSDKDNFENDYYVIN